MAASRKKPAASSATSARSKSRSKKRTTSSSEPSPKTSKKTKSSNATKSKSNSTKPPKERTKTTTTTRRPKDPVPVLILDSGGWNVKHGLVSSFSSSSSSPTTPSHTPNVVGRLRHQAAVLVGDAVDTVRNKAQIECSRPLERGYPVDLGTQVRVWKRVAEREGLVAPARACAFVLDQPFTPVVASERSDAALFEDLRFGRTARRLVQCAAAYRYLNNNDDDDDEPRRRPDGTACCLVVDSGFSATHVVPTFRARAVEQAIRRVNIGGKMLTNLYKEFVSYRQWNMMDEFFLMNEVKEKSVFVSPNFVADLRSARSTPWGRREFDREFLLPDFSETHEGTVRLPAPLRRARESEARERDDEHDGATVATKQEDDEEDDDRQVLALSVERFTVPEILFRPSDVGMTRAAGLAETVAQAVAACPSELRAALYRNVLLTGGNARIPGLAARLESELRSLAPREFEVKITVPDDPVNYAWRGAEEFVRREEETFRNHCCVDREEWEEFHNHHKGGGGGGGGNKRKEGSGAGEWLWEEVAKGKTGDEDDDDENDEGTYTVL